jgi:PAS domain S-box-containing protein
VIRVLQRRRDGTAFPAEIDLADADLGGGRLAVAFVRDIGGQDDIVAALRESEERLRLALEASPIVVYKQDHDLRYTWLYNLDRAVWPDEVAGRTDDDLLPPAEAAVSVALKRQAMASGARVRQEVRATAPTGERVYDLTVEPLKDGTGASLGVTGAAVDVTERRRAEESLRWQADLLDQAYDAIFAWGWDGPILFWNRGAERLYGHAREDVVDRVSHDLLRTRHPKATEEMLRALERDGVWEAELEHVRRDGSLVPVETRHVLVRDARRPYVLEVNRDISERRRAEGALRESEQRLRLAARAARLGTWRFDPATGLVHLDDRMRAIWGEPSGVTSLAIAEVLGRVHPDDRAAVEAAVAGALEPASSGSYDIEYRVVWPDGTERWVAANGQALFGPPDAGTPATGFVGTALDITERKLAEVERTAFVDALAHDLKNPLGAALGQAQLLQRRIRRNGRGRTGRPVGRAGRGRGVDPPRGRPDRRDAGGGARGGRRIGAGRDRRRSRRVGARGGRRGPAGDGGASGAVGDRDGRAPRGVGRRRRPPRRRQPARQRGQVQPRRHRGRRPRRPGGPSRWLLGGALGGRPGHRDPGG